MLRKRSLLFAVLSGAAGLAFASQEVAPPTQTVLVRFLADNGYEAELAKLALTRSSNEKVRQLARALLEDNELAVEVLRGFAQEKGVSLTAGRADVEARAGSMLERLNELDPEASDKALLRELIQTDQSLRDTAHRSSVLLRDRQERRVMREAAAFADTHARLAKLVREQRRQ